MRSYLRPSLGSFALVIAAAAALAAAVPAAAEGQSAEPTSPRGPRVGPPSSFPVPRETVPSIPEDAGPFVAEYVGGDVVLRGPAYEGRFDRDGVRISFSMHEKEEKTTFAYRLSRAQAGSQVLFDARTAVARAPSIAGQSVEYARGEGFTEIYRPEFTGVEQLFRIQSPLPSGADLEIRGDARADLARKRVAGRGVVFVSGQPDAGEAFFYGEPTLIDATGRSVPGELSVSGDEIVLSFKADALKGLQFPVTVDPIIATDLRVTASVSASGELYPAVAWNSVRNEYLVVYEWGPAAGWQYILGQRLAASGTRIGSPITIALNASRDNRVPDVAYSPPTDRYVVVNGIWNGANKGDILMTTVAGNGTLVGSWFVDNSRTAYLSSWVPRIAYQSSIADAFLITWAENDNVTGWWLLGERVNSNGNWVTFNQGTQWNDDWVVHPTIAGAQQIARPSVAYNATEDGTCQR